MKQLELFEDIIDIENTTIRINDKVKIVLIDETVDSEVHNYRKYYFAHVIGKIGIVTNKEQGHNAKKNFLVCINGETIVFGENELQWIG